MDIVIFGLRQLSRLAAYMLTHDSPHRVVGFTVHEQFMSGGEFMGLPVSRFEDLERTHPPERIGLLAPLGWKRMNGLRADVVADGRKKGYTFISYVSSRALTWPDLTIGENCMVFEGCIVQPFARVGENCIIRAGAVLSHDVEVGDHCFVAGRAYISGSAKVDHSCVIGLNSTIREEVRIAPRCFVAAGALVQSATESNGVYHGAPARRWKLTVDDLKSVMR